MKKYFNLFMIHRKSAYHHKIFITPYMVSFCNRILVFLPISGHRYRTEFRFNSSTGSPTKEGGYIGVATGQIAEANKGPHPSPSSTTLIQPQGHPAPIFADGIPWRRRVARMVSAPSQHGWSHVKVPYHPHQHTV